ncbi:MAG: hypothetical protein K9M51_03130 [Candidatus Gracilibacteria bacterium]|nr:hypothetical protein [Candidatus Gracilibacteria bacterium]
MKNLFSSFGEFSHSVRFLFRDVRNNPGGQKKKAEALSLNPEYEAAYKEIGDMTKKELRLLEHRLQATTGEDWEWKFKRGGVKLENKDRNQTFKIDGRQGLFGGNVVEGLRKAGNNIEALEDLSEHIVAAVAYVRTRIEEIVGPLSPQTQENNNHSSAQNENQNQHPNNPDNGGLESYSDADLEKLETLQADVDKLESDVTAAEKAIAEGKASTPAADLRTRLEALAKRTGEIPNALSKDRDKIKERLGGLEGRIDALAQKEAAEALAKKNEALAKAREAVNAIGEVTLYNLEEVKPKIGTAKTAIEKAEKAIADAEKMGVTSEENELKEIQEEFNEKNETYTLYKEGKEKIDSNAEAEQKRVEEEYKEKTQEELDKVEEEISGEIEKFRSDLDSLVNSENKKSPELLDVRDPELVENPTTYNEIFQGMQQHRLESQMLGEEANYLQESAQGFATEVAEFEEKKADFNLKNIANFAISSVAIVPGAIIDGGCWLLEKVGIKKNKKRSMDYLGDFFGLESESEKLRQKQEIFTANFDAKTKELNAKKETLKQYGKTLTTSSETLKTDAPDRVKEEARENVIKELPEGVDIEKEPWKTYIDELILNLEKNTHDAVELSTTQLDDMVDTSVTDIEPNLTITLKGLYDTADYVHRMEIKSATVLDMSVGFLTKNVSKGLNWVGDGLAKIPVIGFVGGVLRAAGGLVEGVGMLITDPDKVIMGLGTLVGLGKTSAGEAWGDMVSAIFGAEAWKNGEYSACIGEAVGNLAAFIFSGGTAATVRGGGLLGRVGSFAGKVGKTAANVAPKTTQLALKTGRTLARVGRPLGRVGDLALTPLRWGMRPLRVSKFTRGAGAKLEKVFQPTKWVKAKPGTLAAQKQLSKASKSYVKNFQKMEKMKAKLKGNKKLSEVDKISLERSFAKLELEQQKLLKNMRGLVEKQDEIYAAVSKDMELANKAGKTSKSLLGKATEKIKSKVPKKKKPGTKKPETIRASKRYKERTRRNKETKTKKEVEKVRKSVDDDLVRAEKMKNQPEKMNWMDQKISNAISRVRQTEMYRRLQSARGSKFCRAIEKALPWSIPAIFLGMYEAREAEDRRLHELQNEKTPGTALYKAQRYLEQAEQELENIQSLPDDDPLKPYQKEYEKLAQLNLEVAKKEVELAEWELKEQGKTKKNSLDEREQERSDARKEEIEEEAFSPEKQSILDEREELVDEKMYEIEKIKKQMEALDARSKELDKEIDEHKN